MSTNPVLTLVKPFTPNNRREKLWEKHGRKCHWCGCDTQISWNNLPTDATIDHILPRSDGGTDDPSNVVSACNSCNGRRDYEWKKRLGEGSLLGKWPIRTPQQKAMRVPRIKQTEDILREQRDQAQKEIALLRKEKKAWEGALTAQTNELKLFHKIVEDQEEELKALKSLTVWKFIRKKLAEWIKP
jgi:HNH endonuclease